MIETLVQFLPTVPTKEQRIAENRGEVEYRLEEKHKKEESIEEHLERRRRRREHRIEQKHLKRRKIAFKKEEKKSIEESIE